MITLTALLQSHELSDGVPLLPKPALLLPGHLLMAKPSSFNRQRPVSVNALHVNFSDGSSFDIPPSTTLDVQYIAQCYTAAVHVIQADPRKFSNTSECAVCEGTGHLFAYLSMPFKLPSPMRIVRILVWANSKHVLF